MTIDRAMTVPHPRPVELTVTTRLTGAAPTTIRTDAAPVAALLDVPAAAVVDLLRALDGRRLGDELLGLLTGLLPAVEESGRPAQHRGGSKADDVVASWEALREWYAAVVGADLPSAVEVRALAS
ncbi:hypothetical protein [Kineococcus terrestris]|uniref:hypothetical protein n=1 Tax=Kineococcus terrestris TaxID=2044856 RepID=UPI0034DAF565